MALNQIPYTNVHELNLDWILSEIKKFDEYISSIKSTIDQLSQYYEIVDDLQSDVSSIRSEVNSYSGRITNLESGISDLRSTIDKVEYDLMDLILNEGIIRKSAITDLQNQINSINSSMADIDAIRKQIEVMYRSIQIYIKSAITTSESELYKHISTIYSGIMSEINNIYNMLTNIAINVYNAESYSYASDGGIGFDLNNRLLYQNLGNNLTVSEYASLGLTVSKYAAHSLTEKQYIEQGKKWLHYDFIFMPMTGIRQSHENALSDVITCLASTLSCGSYRDLDLTVSDYDVLDLTTRQYIFLDQNMGINNHVVSNSNSSGLTVDQYDSLMIKEV